MARPLPIALALAALLAGCLSREEVVPTRYFEPSAAQWPEASPAAEPGELRLARIASPDHLSEQVAWRISPVEIGYYDEVRWIREPAQFLERALTHELFVRRGWIPTQDPGATSLSVELLAFEELLAPRHEAHIAVSVTLRSGTAAAAPPLRIEAAHPIASDDPESMATAMGHALVALVGRIADALSRE